MQTLPRPRLASSIARVPLGGSYPAAVALALIALCPFIVLTTAFALVQQDVVKDLGATQFSVQLAAGLANAAYAFGAVAAADLVQRLPSRWVYIACETAFVAGSLMALLASGVELFTVGRVLQGLATGMLLVAALPPLVTNHGAERLPATAAVVNLGLFGMVTLGPVVGGVAGSLHGWRVLLAVVAALGAVGVVLGLFAFERREPTKPGAHVDRWGIALAVAATALPFIGASWLTKGSFGSPAFFLPIGVGLLAVVVLVVHQYRMSDRALMPVKPIAHTLPVTGTIGAMVVGAAFTTLIALVEIFLMDLGHRSPAAIGGLVAAQLAGVAVAAWIFKQVLPTKGLPYLALTGLASVAVAAVLLLFLTPSGAGLVVPVAALLLGFGAGAGVAPGLFMAGLSVPSSQIGPTFALVELLRSEAAFLVGPILLHVVMTSSDPASGFTLAVAIILALVVLTGVALVGLYLLGGARPHRPDLEGWLGGDETAFHSPRVAALLRDG